MEISGYELDIEKARDELEDIGAKRILLQVPDGLIRKAGQILDEIGSEGAIWGGTCYGACDLPPDIGEADALVHVGHSEIPNMETDYPVVYIEGWATRFSDIPEGLFERLEGKVALYSTVQYLHHLDKIKKALEENGFEVLIEEGDGRIKYPGQILGCDYSAMAVEADSHLYIGSGRFHPIGLSLVSGDNVIIFNPTTGEVSETGDLADKMLRKRHAVLSASQNKMKESDKYVGVIVSTKGGQERMKMAEKIASEDDRVKIIVFDEIIPSRVDSMDLCCAVNTACPRIALDDSIRFKTTILTPVEFEILKGKVDWGDWSVDQIS